MTFVWAVTFIGYYDQPQPDDCDVEGPHLFAKREEAYTFARDRLAEWAMSRIDEQEDLKCFLDEFGQLTKDPFELLYTAVNQGDHVPHMTQVYIKQLKLPAGLELSKAPVGTNKRQLSVE